MYFQDLSGTFPGVHTCYLFTALSQTPKKQTIRVLNGLKRILSQSSKLSEFWINGSTCQGLETAEPNTDAVLGSYKTSFYLRS